MSSLVRLRYLSMILQIRQCFKYVQADDLLGFSWVSVLGREMDGRNACFREQFLRDFRSTQPKYWLSANQQWQGEHACYLSDGVFSIKREISAVFCL